VLTGVALIMTFFALGPTFSEINEVALTPLAEKEISLGEALVRGYEPLRQNVLQRVDEDDVGFFYEMTRDPVPATTDQIDFPHLIAAHVLGELRVSFSLGFIIFIPFLVVDLIVANVLLALGMAMLSPPIISLPFKIMIFVAVDGWALIMRGLLESFL
jgi:flagellar biosynthetic protein FliP